MALNGTFYGTTSNANIRPKIVWSATQSVTGNYSTVTASLYYSRTDTGYTTYGTGSFSITINGSKKTASKNITITSNSNTLAITYSVNVPHKTDGTQSITISATGAIAGTSLSSTTISATGALNTIPRKSTLAASNGTLGTAQTLTVTRQSTSFTHTITYKCSSASGTVCTKSTSTSISFTPPLSLASQNTTGTTVSVVFTITTYSGGTSLGSNTKTISCSIPSSVKPSCTVTVTDAMGYESTYGGYVKGLSKFKVVVTPTISYGSAIASYSTSANGSKYTTTSFTTGVLKSSGSLTVSATVKDKRGRSGSASVTKTVLAYTNPNIVKLTVKRCDQDGTENAQGEYVQVLFSGTVTSLNDKNSAAYVIRYKKTSDTTYTSVTLSDIANTYSVTDYSYIFEADTGSSYNVDLTITDDFGSEGRSTSASTGFTLMHFIASGTGMSVGKIAEIENGFDVGLNSYFRKDVCVGNKTGYMDGKTGVYLDAEGFINIQRETSQGYSPHIRFIHDDVTATSDTAVISYNTSDEMTFTGASDYRFDSAIYMTSGSVVFEKSGRGVLFDTTWGRMGIVSMTSPSRIAMYTKISSSSDWSSSVVLANEDGINIVPKTGGAFTGNISTSGTFTAKGKISTTNSIEASGNITATGNVIAMTSVKSIGRLYSEGTYTATGTAAANMIISSNYWTYRSTASSKRYKHDIYDIGTNENLNSEKLLEVPIRQYKYNEDYISDTDQRYNTDVPGFIAEELYEHYPISVEIQDGKIEDWNHRMIIPPMLDLIQKLWNKVNVLEGRIA